VKKSILTILSITFVVSCIIIAFNYLNKGQQDTGLDVLALNEINNAESFLWIDEKLDKTVFYISGIEMEKIRSNNNPYFEIIFNISDIENNKYPSDGFDFKSNVGEFSKNKLKVSYNQLIGNNDIKITLEVIPEIVVEGNYFFDVELINGGFDLTNFNNGVPLRLELPINKKSPALKIWLIIIFIALFLSSLVWFILLKKMFYPTFSERGKLIVSDPITSTIFLNKNARKLIFGNEIDEKENFITKLFCGKVQYELASAGHNIVISPFKDWKTKKNRYRLLCKNNSRLTNMASDSHMKHLDKYEVKTNDKLLSFKYFNIKHR